MVKEFWPNLSAEKTRENARKQELLRAFGGRLVRRSHAPKAGALPTALHPGGCAASAPASSLSYMAGRAAPCAFKRPYSIANRKGNVKTLGQKRAHNRPFAIDNRRQPCYTMESRSAMPMQKASAAGTLRVAVANDADDDQRPYPAAGVRRCGGGTRTAYRQYRRSLRRRAGKALLRIHENI